MITIIAVGDIMPGGLLHGTEGNCVSGDIQSIMARGDVRVGTLECAIGNDPDFIEEKMNRYGDVIYSPDEDLKRLVELNINVVSLANNHFFDLKETGAIHAIEMLNRLGIAFCGAGRNIEEARKPAVLEVNGVKVAFLAFCDYHKYMGYIPFATENSAGVNPMYDDYVIEEIEEAKKEYQYVVVLPHWGKEHTFETTIWCYEMAKKMMAAGADLILGSHSHRVQPIVSWRNKTVAFSMGNFLFPERLIAPPLRSTYYPPNTIDISTLPVTDNFPAVEVITYKKWKPLAKYGMIVESVIDERKRIKTQGHITYLGKDNCLVLKSDKAISNGLAKYSFLISYTPYDFLLRVRNKVNYTLSRKKNIER